MMRRTLEHKNAPGANSQGVGESRNPDSSPRQPSRSRLFGPTRQFDPNEPELMDRPDVNKAWLREELEVLEKLNRLGGHQLILHYIRKLLTSTKVEPLTVLDLATGAADIPRAIVAWARKKGLRIKLTAVDRNENVLRSAKEWCRDWPEIKLQQHDLLQLPYGPGSFDIVLCSLALHHFKTE